MKEELEAILSPSQVIVDPASMRAYDCDAYSVDKATPTAVVLPESTEQVAAVVSWCHANNIPFVARGAGTGLSGGALAISGGVIISTKRLTRILEIDIPNRRLKAQTGAVNRKLSEAVEAQGFHFAPDPSSQSVSTLGGNIGENSGGPHTLKYGVTVQHIFGVTMVSPEGEIWNLTAGAPGYDLLGVIVGSEGTLGIVTEAWVKLTPTPKAVKTALASFPSVMDATLAVSAIIADGILPAALEMMDRGVLDALELAFDLRYPAGTQALLLIECDGVNAEIVETQMDRALALCANALEVTVAQSEAERQKFWTARKKGIGAMGRLAPTIVTHDGVIPRSKLPETLQYVYEVAKRLDLKVANIFHAGDGNLHPCFYFDDRDPVQVKHVIEAGELILTRCIELGGSISGEHGVGVEKIDFMKLMFSKAALDVMAKTKRIFNQGELCNPCKLLPNQKGCSEFQRRARGAAW